MPIIRPKLTLINVIFSVTLAPVSSSGNELVIKLKSKSIISPLHAAEFDYSQKGEDGARL
jgi:hypothetical protein